MKLQIELKEEQLSLLINALEVNFRLMMHQGSIAADLLAEFPIKDGMPDEKWKPMFERYLAHKEDAEYLVTALSNVLYGSNYIRLPDDCHRLSDMWSAFRHAQWQLLGNPDDHSDVRSWKPFQMSDYPMIKVEVIDDGCNGLC